MGGHGGKARTPAAKVCVEATGGLEQVGPCPWDSGGPSSFVRASWSANTQPGHPDTIPLSSLAVSARLVFQGLGQ